MNVDTCFVKTAVPHDTRTTETCWFGFWCFVASQTGNLISSSASKVETNVRKEFSRFVCGCVWA